MQWHREQHRKRETAAEQPNSDNWSHMVRGQFIKSVHWPPSLHDWPPSLLLLLLLLPSSHHPSLVVWIFQPSISRETRGGEVGALAEVGIGGVGHEGEPGWIISWRSPVVQA